MRTPPCPTPAAPCASSERSLYLSVLTWSFAFFNSVHVLAYLPTIWAICASGDSQQHSWFTWLTWAGAKATMAAWLYEQNSRCFTRAAAVNVCNAAMCLATLVLILAFRT
jgi:hypothetical protein